ncbi:NlpC/P60-like cell-wall peptidase [Penicillium alfredii]|uniref:NlpC/P60-like cell-wall peptidase n=1 Tax=Penicillium alfredii TaxID=1506179 RepID=A0A9W9FL95_9EURO|nr:NlpC/P60-like cell-wall peptidase [Penicillium alfredii]KAJ5102278.1 NlpC/P60-like cell-wall peptidase [Penicillium alfredii]
MHYISLVAVTLAAALPAVSAYPIEADSVHCRSGPGTNHEVVKSYKKGEDIKVTCQTAGEDINGDKLWDKTSDNCYVADYYVKTGTSQYVVDKCPSQGGNDDNNGGGNSGGSGSGKGIVDAAEKEKGLPYVWGGGNCHGPTQGGFDCSGLTQYAVCQALKKEIPRTAQTQYQSKLGKHIPRAQAEEGDLIFWGKNGDCTNGVVHVGIFIRDGLMINAAHTGTPVREQKIWTSSGGEEICPDAVRFT